MGSGQLSMYCIVLYVLMHEGRTLTDCAIIAPNVEICFTYGKVTELFL